MLIMALGGSEQTSKNITIWIETTFLQIRSPSFAQMSIIKSMATVSLTFKLLQGYVPSYRSFYNRYRRYGFGHARIQNVNRGSQSLTA